MVGGENAANDVFLRRSPNQTRILVGMRQLACGLWFFWVDVVADDIQVG
jgi:hypothetical protein